MAKEKSTSKKKINEDVSDTITLLAIQLATQLKYGSKQSREYLAEAKSLLMKKRLNEKLEKDGK